MRGVLDGPTPLGTVLRAEERVERIERLRTCLARVRSARSRARDEPLAPVRALAVRHALGAGLAALVVGTGIVVRAVPARVQIGVTVGALVAKADPFAARERMLPIAGTTAHALTLRQRSEGVKRRPSALRSRGDSLRAMAASLRRILLAIALACTTAGADPDSASAQGRGGPDVTDFALAWARGSFASPVVCRFPDGAKRGLRRVVVEPGPRTSEQRVDRIQFMDLGAKEAERCSDELGGEEPNVIGTIYVTHTLRRPHSDTPERDFKQDLERGPILFDVVRGRLRVGSATRAVDELPDVDFAGGRLRLGTIEPGSDDARRIADLPGARQLRLELEADDGPRVVIPLVELETR